MKKLELPNQSATKKIAGIFRGIFVAALGCLLASNAPAEVHIARFDPPLSVSAFSDPLPGLDWNTTAVDFDLDGQTDFRLTYGSGMMTAYFNTPTRIAMRATTLNTNTGPIMPALVLEPLGPVASVPLGSMIGSNIVSSTGTNFYAWEPGITNSYNLPELLGDHIASVILANEAVPVGPEPVITFSTNGTWVTNVYYPGPFILGDVTGKEAVMALQFYIGSELHYGYIHFNFDEGAGGVIYGWAYETEPNVPIKAMPLLPGEKLKKGKILLNLK